MVQPIQGSRVTPLSAETWRMSGGYRQSPGVVTGTGADWFGPLNPQSPSAPPEVAGRMLDYPSGYNLEITPRPYEPIKFPDLRALADGYDILRTIIETRKDQMEKLGHMFQPKTAPDGSPRCDPNDERINALTDFFEMPDKVHYWGEWLRMLLEDMFVIDAATLFRRRTRGGELYSLEPIDGATIKRVIDDWGRTPAPPVPAFQQILKGLPAVNYTTDDLLYLPRNTRVNKFYGYSPVEQIVMSVNIALRRELFQLQYYTEGNMPEALCGAPDGWTPEQIGKFQNAFDAMLAGNQAIRRRIKFVPGGVAKTFIPTKEPELTGKQDEWLARVCCFAFSVSPQPFVSMMNRATAETAHDAAAEEGLAPVQAWVTRMINRVITQDFGYTDIEFAWKDDREVDPKVQMEVLTGYVARGVIKRNEARDQLGQPPDPDGDMLMADTPSGPIPVGTNKDMPTAGEQAQQKADQADAQAEALAAGGGAPGQPGKKPGDEGKKPAAADDKEAGKSAVPFDLSKRRQLRPMTHRTKAVTSGETRLRAILVRAFKELARQATKKALESFPHIKLAKVGDDGLDWEVLVAPTAAQLEAVARDGAKRALITIGLEDDESIVNDTYDAAVTQARNRAAELVGMKYDESGALVENPNAEYAISATTRDEIRQAVSEAIEEGLSADDLADRIRDIGSFSADRAEMIARTEIIRANNEGHMAAFRASGVVEQKAWSTAEDVDCCDGCLANQEQGPIGLDEEFESGDVAPPMHPNCRCTLVPVVDNSENEE